MSDIGKIKERIRKLLNLAADDGAAEGEIDNALRAARRLMLQHQIGEDDVAAAPEQLKTPEQIAADTSYGTAKSWGAPGRAPAWIGQLAMAVAAIWMSRRFDSMSAPRTTLADSRPSCWP